MSKFKKSVSPLSVLLLIVGAMLSLASSPEMGPMPAFMTLICETCDLSDWDVSDGSMEKVSTWHEHELATSLSGNPFSARTTGTVSQAYAIYFEDDEWSFEPEELGCIAISYFGQLDGEVTVTLSVDLDDDGEMDVSVDLEPVEWTSDRVVLQQDGVLYARNFQLDKVGEGEAILDNLALETCWPEELLDCAGVAGGESRVDECGVCDADSANDC